MISKKARKWLKEITVEKEKMMNSRDKIRDLVADLQGELDTFDEGIEYLNAAEDALDELSQFI